MPLSAANQASRESPGSIRPDTRRRSRARSRISIRSTVWDERTRGEPIAIPTLPSRRRSRHLSALGWPSTTRIADRVGVLIGSGMGGAETLDAGMETVLTEGPSRLSPFFMPMFLGNMASGTVAIATGARGPNFAPVSACASSAHAIGEAAAIIRRGEADVMIAGGSEAPLARMVVAGFNAMGALSTRNDDPAAASRPFDAERDGFVLGEGGAALILESAEHAARRGASVLAELDRVWRRPTTRTTWSSPLPVGKERRER